MKWDIKRSDELAEAIARNEGLTRQLSETVDKLFKEHGVELKDVSYVFEPRVFSMDSRDAPEIMMKSRVAMLQAIMEDLMRRGLGSQIDEALDASRFQKCLPQCGPLDPSTLRALEKYRISDRVAADDPVPVSDSVSLMRRIVGNKRLLEDFSKSVFGLLQKNGITLKENEGCVFTPMVFEAPVFAQKVASTGGLHQFHGFGPQIFADPDPTPWKFLRFKPLPGVIQAKWGPTAGIIIHHWWWIGIPAPEFLRALDVMRDTKG